ncbi:unnamed protein product [Rotaria sordida]|uniref:Uncharacterized protein n=1 Tax=Rotaria sordida TaxID=392033 RepID=A0A815Z6Y1_9BILA|nr:unnamed protein product [Rotaria sordida]CAF1580165.1 unnamed protein product [Rotaria sordida]
MTTKKQINEKSMVVKGVNGSLEWVIYVGKWNHKDLFQSSHEWLFDDKGRERAGTIFIDKLYVDIRHIIIDTRPNRPYFIWKDVT